MNGVECNRCFIRSTDKHVPCVIQIDGRAVIEPITTTLLCPHQSAVQVVFSDKDIGIALTNQHGVFEPSCIAEESREINEIVMILNSIPLIVICATGCFHPK